MARQGASSPGFNLIGSVMKKIRFPQMRFNSFDSDSTIKIPFESSILWVGAPRSWNSSTLKESIPKALIFYDTRYFAPSTER